MGRKAIQATCGCPVCSWSKGQSGLNPSDTLDHVALGIDNVEELCQHLDSMGVKVDRPLSEIPGSDGKPFALAAFYYDPDGNRVEVFKYI